MDLKVTKQRFNEHWTYDWVKYLCFILVAIFVVSLVFSVTARRLTDTEELKIIIYSQNSTCLEPYKTGESLREYILSQNLEGSEYLDNKVEYYAYGGGYDYLQAAAAKLDADKSTGGIDILLLPILEEYYDENGAVKSYANTFNYHVGIGYYISIDEVIEIELQKNNPVAQQLKDLFYEHPEYLYKCARITPNNDYTGVVEHDLTLKSYGLNLNALDLSKVNRLIYDNPEMIGNEICNYSLGIVRDSGSYAEALCFINWFIQNYTA